MTTMESSSKSSSDSFKRLPKKRKFDMSDFEQDESDKSVSVIGRPQVLVGIAPPVESNEGAHRSMLNVGGLENVSPPPPPPSSGSLHLSGISSSPSATNNNHLNHHHYSNNNSQHTINSQVRHSSDTVTLPGDHLHRSSSVITTESSQPNQLSNGTHHLPPPHHHHHLQQQQSANKSIVVMTNSQNHHANSASVPSNYSQHSTFSLSSSTSSSHKVIGGGSNSLSSLSQNTHSSPSHQAPTSESTYGILQPQQQQQQQIHLIASPVGGSTGKVVIYPGYPPTSRQIPLHTHTLSPYTSQLSVPVSPSETHSSQTDQPIDLGCRSTSNRTQVEVNQQHHSASHQVHHGSIVDYRTRPSSPPPPLPASYRIPPQSPHHVDPVHGNNRAPHLQKASPNDSQPVQYINSSYRRRTSPMRVIIVIAFIKVHGGRAHFVH